jgi:hypothetical protein
VIYETLHRGEFVVVIAADHAIARISRQITRSLEYRKR